MNRVLYYLILYPLSRLPLLFLYALSSVLFFTLYYIVGYRRTVVEGNLKRSFPEMTRHEMIRLERKFYRYLAQLFAESLKNLSIGQKALSSRIRVENPEVLDQYFVANRSVLLVGGHYLNWEYLITAQSLLFKHQAVGIGQPLSNKFWDRKLTQRRERFGMRVVNAQNLKDKLGEWQDENLAILVLFDQNPPDYRRAYWTQFLNQTTAFLFGTEKLAVSHNLPVVFFELHQKKKGHYTLRLRTIAEHPRKEEYGVITNKIVTALETQILAEPAYWLWSHKRWKHKIPEDLSTLCTSQREQYMAWKKALSVQ